MCQQPLHPSTERLLPSQTTTPNVGHNRTHRSKPHLDFNLVEGLAVVHANHGAHHLGQDDHVSQVSLDHLGLLHGRGLLLGLTQTLQERLLLATEAAVQPPPLAGAVQLHQLLAGGGGQQRVRRKLVSYNGAARELLA